MAIKLTKGKDSIKVIIREDDALPEALSDADYEVYTETLDETHLKLPVGSKPTRFVLKSDLSFAAQKKIDNEKMSINADGQAVVNIGFILEEIRCCLIGIECEDAEAIKFSKESDGFASKELVGLLHSAGIVMQLYSVRQKHTGSKIPQKK